MNDHALHVLEYADLLEYLSRYTESEVARSIILNAEPETDYRSIKYQLDLLTEFRKLRWSGHPIPTIRGPENDWSDNIRSSKLENWILTADCIAGIGRIIDMTTTISDGMKKLETIPLLKQTVDRLVKLPELSRSISRTVSDKGGILDSASPQLALFRRNIRKQQERIRTRLEEMAVSLYEKGAVQEPIVTIRNGRYVLPVRSGSVRDVPGMVHDRSASGATFFIEPKGSMSDHNALTKLEADVLQEETRILRELTSHIGKQADLILRNIEIIVELDVLQAKARFCDEVKAEPIEPERTPVAHIIGGRNPLLVLHRLFSHDPEERVRPVVPLDVTVDDSHRVLIITGPNTGGKTVALRTIGLLVLMVQTGLHPTCAESSRIGLFHNIFADIGDEQSVQQSLSTFSSHVKQIIKILELADHRSLVLLDELGAGTDPAEGSALGIAILVELLQRGVWVIANTHHNTIKAFAYTTEGISNAAMEFNIDTLEPTYRIVMGRIGQSNALAIAARLGFPDRLVHRARDHMEGKILDLQTMLDEVDRSRLQAEEQIARANNERSRARELRQAREDVLKRAEREAKEILDKTTRDSQQLLADIYHQRDILKKELNALRKRSLPDAEATEAAERIVKTHGKAVDHLVAQVDDLMDRSIPVNESPFDPDTLTEGDMIWVKRFRKEARFVKLDGDKYLWVDMQGKKVRVECSGVGWVRSGHSPTTGTSRPPVEISVDVSEPIMPLLRLNLVGKRVDEALDELDRYMDQVIRSGISEITIIHGFGTGKLQDAVVKYLRRTSRVLSARSGDASEGGGGVTVVRMNTGD